MNKRFLKQLKAAGKVAGLMQADVAKLLRLPQSFVAKCESGNRRVDVVELTQFAKVYGKALDPSLGEAEKGRRR